MELAEAMRTQRAVRRLRPDPVDNEVLLRCLSLAVRAPTGGNQQGWEFILVRDPATKAAIGRQYRMCWALYRALGRRVYGGNEKVRKMIEAVQWQVDHWEEIPVLVVACLRGVSLPVPWILRSSRYGSIYPAIQNFLLAARAEGLGATLTTIPLWNRIAVHRILEVPWNVEPVALIPVGWPRGGYGPTSRRAIEAFVHLDRFGNRPFLNPAARRSGHGSNKPAEDQAGREYGESRDDR
ncbi:MAG: nitroreductase family protein [Actinomycetota bacterium]